MKKQKRYLIVLSVLFLIVMVTACKPYVDWTPMAEEQAKEYAEEKYGDLLVFDRTEEWTTGMIKGQPYWLAYFTNEEGEEFKVCVRRDENNNLYVDYDTYYIHYMEPALCEWLAEYLDAAGLKNYMIYCMDDGWSADWSVDYSVEEILDNQRENEGLKGYLCFQLLMPEREKEVIDSGALVHSLNDIQEYASRVDLNVYIYDDETYDNGKDDGRNLHGYLKNVELLREDTDE